METQHAANADFIEGFKEALAGASTADMALAVTAGTEHLFPTLGEDPPGLLRCQVCGNHPASDSEFGVLCHLDYTRELAAANPVPLPQNPEHLKDLAVLRSLENKTWITECDVCGQRYENGVGSTPCCGAMQHIVENTITP